MFLKLLLVRDDLVHTSPWWYYNISVEIYSFKVLIVYMLIGYLLLLIYSVSDVSYTYHDIMLRYDGLSLFRDLREAVYPFIRATKCYRSGKYIGRLSII